MISPPTSTRLALIERELDETREWKRDVDDWREQISERVAVIATKVGIYAGLGAGLGGAIASAVAFFVFKH